MELLSRLRNQTRIHLKLFATFSAIWAARMIQPSHFSNDNTNNTLQMEEIWSSLKSFSLLFCHFLSWIVVAAAAAFFIAQCCILWTLACNLHAFMSHLEGTHIHDDNRLYVEKRWNSFKGCFASRLNSGLLTNPNRCSAWELWRDKNRRTKVEI